MSFLSKCWLTYKARRSLTKLKLIKAQRLEEPVLNEPKNWFTKFVSKFKQLWRRRRDERKTKQDNNYWLLKSVIGFLFGILVTFVTYFFLIYQLNYDETTALYFSILNSFILPLGLAFSQTFRCILSLALPQIFTGKGRIVLLAYIFIIAHNGPMQNAMTNLNVLINSTICAQHKVINLLPTFLAENLQTNVNTSEPIGFEDVVRTGQEKMNEALMSFNVAFLSMESLFNETWADLDKQHSWLTYKQIICKKLRTRIYYIIDGLTGSLFQNWKIVAFSPWLPVTLQQTGKAIVDTGFKSACGYGDEEDFDLFGIKKILMDRLDNIKEYVKKESDFRVDFTHSYSYNLTQTKSFLQIQDDILTEIKSTFSWVNSIVYVSSLTLGSMIFMVFLKAFMYNRKYGKSAKFDNFYISSELIELDRRRELLGLEKILPLKRRERRYYVPTFSIRLAKPEKRKFMANFILWLVASFNIVFYMALDYAIFWLAGILSTYGGITLTLKGSILPRINIVGDGILSSVFRSIVEAFDPFTNSYVPSVDLTPCLPNVNPPDYATYIRIGHLLFLSLLVTFLSAWLLRIRHLIAAIYNPGMEMLRAAWLHRKIISQRTFGLKSLRKKLRKSILKDPGKVAFSLLEYIVVTFPWIGKILEKLGGFRRIFCLVCGESATEGDENYTKCDNISCKGMYCRECYDDLQNICPLCKKLVDYGQYSDVSEECDSSEDDNGDQRSSSRSMIEEDTESDEDEDETKRLISE